LNPNLPAGHPPVDADLPAGHPPIGPAAQPNTKATNADVKTANDLPKFTAPASWKQEPGSGMSKVDFVISDAQQRARVKVIPFRDSEGQMIGDPLSNINRWRGEVGLEPIQQDKLAANSESIQIDGKPAMFAAMIPDAKGDQSKDAPATLAAMAHSSGQIWFIKMMGSRDLVAARKDEFKAFLKTLKFPTEGGAVDGNK
jgi:hypothetical protein